MPWAKIVPGTSCKPCFSNRSSRAYAELFAGKLLVDRVLGNVDVNAQLHLLGQFDAGSERFLLERETRVGSDHRGELLAAAALFREAGVLRHSPLRFIFCVAISHFVAQHTPTADLCDPFLQRRQAAFDSAWGEA